MSSSIENNQDIDAAKACSESITISREDFVKVMTAEIIDLCYGSEVAGLAELSADSLAHRAFDLLKKPQ